MTKLLVCTVLIAISLNGKLFAQDNKQKTLSRTESNFNMHPSQAGNKHWVYLPKDEKMLIELHNAADYNILADIESQLAGVMNDIAFYKDSLSPTGNVHVDYALSIKENTRKIRFKRYAPDGDLFLSKDHDVSKLKIEQDTIRIVFERSIEEKSSYNWYEHDMVSHRDIPVQVTFYLNNYDNLSTMLKNKGMLNSIIDTLAETSNPKHKTNVVYSAIAYRPFEINKYNSRFKKVNFNADQESDVTAVHGTLQITGSVGLGVIRNTITPMAEIGIEINDRWKVTPHKFSFIRASAMPYFFFEKGGINNISVYDNWFATLEAGTQLKENRHSFGIGYLFAEKGGYFQNTTMKAFVTFTVGKRIILSPEFIFTNNFKQIFPGVTIRF